MLSLGMRVLLMLGLCAALLISCGSPSPSSAVDPSQPQAVVPAAISGLTDPSSSLHAQVLGTVARFNQPTRASYAGDLRIDVATSGQLPETITIQGSVFKRMSEILNQGFVSYGADLDSALNKLDPFQELSLSVADGARVELVSLVSPARVGLIYQGNPTSVSTVDVAIVLATLQSDPKTADNIANRTNQLLSAPGLVSAASLNPVPTEDNTDYVNKGTGKLNTFDVAAVLAVVQVGTDKTAIANRMNQLLSTPGLVTAADITVVPGQGIPGQSPSPSPSPGIPLGQTINVPAAGILRFDISSADPLPASFSLQNAKYVKLPIEIVPGKTSYAALLADALKPLTPFQQIQIPGVQQAQILVYQSEYKNAAIYQQNPSIVNKVTFLDYVLVNAVYQIPDDQQTATSVAAKANNLFSSVNVLPSSLSPVPTFRNAGFTRTADIQNVNIVYSATFIPPSKRTRENLKLIAQTLYPNPSPNEILYQSHLIKAIPGEVLPSDVRDNAPPGTPVFEDSGILLNSTTLQSSPNRVYYYNAAFQNFENFAVKGVIGGFATQKPKIESDSLLGLDPLPHSIFQIAAIKANSTTAQNTVEFGWIVSKANLDEEPHLFVARNVNGNYRNTRGEVCYDYTSGCGWTPNEFSTVKVGDSLSLGSYPLYEIIHINSQWQVKLDSQIIGYYPDSLWNNSFTDFNRANWQGEVYSNQPMFKPCSQMGSGELGLSPANAFKAYYKKSPIPGERYYDAEAKFSSKGKDATTGQMIDIPGIESLYKLVPNSGSSMSYGGPGAC